METPREAISPLRWGPNPIPEREELRKLITRYTDELLKRAIDRGVLPPVPESDEDIADSCKEMLNSFMPTPDILLEGVMMLYTTDAERANARLKQYFEKVQSVPDLNKQLKMCYAMLRVLNGAVQPFGVPPVFMPGGGAV